MFTSVRAGEPPNLLPPADILQHVGLPVAMPLLPEDRNLVVLAGDGYVAGTALALILFPEPTFPPKSVKHRFRQHEYAQAETALRIKRIAMGLALVLAGIWLLGNLDFFGSPGYHFLPSDHSLFAAIPLFGIADMMAAVHASIIVRHKQESVIRQRELGDTTGQLFSVALGSVYLGFWTVAFLSSRW